MKLGMEHMGLLRITFCSNYDAGLTFNYFKARSNIVTQVFLKVITMGFSETNAVCNLKVGRCGNQLHVCEYSNSIALFDLGPR